MDKEDQITQLVNEKNELIDINELFQIYMLLNLELVELKHKHNKKSKPIYFYNPELWNIKRINYLNNEKVLEYILYRKLGGNMLYYDRIKNVY